MNKRNMKLLVIAVCAVVIAITIAVVLTARNNSETIEKSVQSAVSSDKQPEKLQTTPPEAAQDVENEKTTVDTSSTPNQQSSSANSAPTSKSAQPTTKKQGAHVPFTQKKVTAGDSESYKNTVGQCPFYEMAGEKGCVPPPDIECNDDWSVCKMKGQE